MASIFTYETEIPRVSSPWLRQPESPKSRNGGPADAKTSLGNPTPSTDGTITRLEAEPQDGPVEYKLHLLLRPRRNFSSMSTVTSKIGSNPQNAKFNGPSQPRSSSESQPNLGTTPVSTQQSRQHRLEQLTTQLLWRLQQSSPNHASSSTNVVLPSFPEASTELRAPPRPAKLPHGLEESQGALYEIGVSDDGTFVGLAEDEMLESLNNLRAMAACLGCVVEVQRMVEVGACDWTETKLRASKVEVMQRTGKLVVAEALVKPALDYASPASTPHVAEQSTVDNLWANGSHTASQLRVSFTGATVSGKSSLLGALSTSTLDNGRGQSRLSMLKHRHEINSGITSSITQELIGYRDEPNGDMDIVNYASEGISSWLDMHAAATNGRLVFASDSAGHPRYRRTTVRSLVGWSPHWAILCIPADDEGNPSGQTGSATSTGDMLGRATGDADLSAAHLDLCLRLRLPLVVAITKFDLASKTGLRLTMTKLLSIIKAAGRNPILIPNPASSAALRNSQVVASSTVRSVKEAIRSVATDVGLYVPIVMTSAVQGTGLDVLHSLLRELPIANAVTRPAERVDSQKTPVFHIEDVYNKTLDGNGVVVSGHLLYSDISVGDHLILGPSFTNQDDSEDSDGQWKPSPKPLATSRSFPGALNAHGSLLAQAKTSEQEWQHVVVSSIRNLRLPVNTLHADQVGTIGLKLAESDDSSLLPAGLKIRKGMVLLSTPAKSTSTFVAQFKREDLGSLAVGSQVVLYVASVRATARVVSARTPDYTEMDARFGSMDLDPDDDDDDAVDLLDGEKQDDSNTAGQITDRFLMVTLHFESAKEYVETGSHVLVMPGGGPGLFGSVGEKGVAGLEGFVGVVTETCD